MKNKKTIGVLAAIGGLLVLGLIALLLLGGKSYKVIFDSDGGTQIPQQEVKKGKTATKPEDPEKKGYEFVQWEYDGTEFDFDQPIEQDYTLVARYKEAVSNKHKVTITVDGKKKELEVSKLTQEDIEKLYPPKAGYEFKLYANGKEYDIDTPLTEDVVLTGKYEKVANYTVKFNSDGGTAVASQTIAPGGKVKEPTDPTKEAYVFEGWYLNNTKYDFSSEVKKSFTLVAKWTEDPNVKRYTVTFDSDGGSKVNSQKVIENKTVTKPANPTRTGYKFIEWQLNGTAYNFSTKVTKDITLKAKWEQVITYKVTFNSDGGSSVATQTIEKGKTATKPANPTRSGYTFIGWQLNGSTYNFSTPVTANIELTAVWEREKAKYTVTFNSNGGTAVANQTITEGSTVSRPSNPTRSGFTFKAWTLNGSNYDFSTPVTSDLTLTATWTEIVNYTVRITRVDNYSPDSKLTVYKNGTQITYNAIKFTDGTPIPGGVTKTSNLQGETQFIVVLTSGEEVTATVE